MTKKHILTTAGVSILSIICGLAISRTKKKAAVPSLYWASTHGCLAIATATNIFTTGGTGGSMFFRDASGSIVAVFTTRTVDGLCANPVNVRLK